MNYITLDDYVKKEKLEMQNVRDLEKVENPGNFDALFEKHRGEIFNGVVTKGLTSLEQTLYDAMNSAIEWEAETSKWIQQVARQANKRKTPGKKMIKKTTVKKAVKKMVVKKKAKAKAGRR